MVSYSPAHTSRYIECQPLGDMPIYSQVTDNKSVTHCAGYLLQLVLIHMLTRPVN